MAQFVACGEPHLTSTHIAFIRYLNRTIESIRRDIADTFAAIFGSENNLAPSVSTRCEDDIALSSTKYLISAIGKKCHLIAQDCSSNEKSFRDKKGPDVVFNVLDNILKDSLERLKMMRENISLAKIDLQGCTFVYNYTEHAATIRSLCLEGKLGAAMWLRRKMVQKGLIPDVFTHNHIVNGLCRTGLAEKADWFIREMLEFEVKCGNFHDACTLKEEMIIKVQILFSTYCKRKRLFEAFNLYQQWLASKRDNYPW
ncbi:pentatricopeptide repeat-containing protein At5g24830 isoform X7 [Arachis ipaensis]|uniref:pentatricopeptide repeat-containing protein At5g24830 isoform X7 n=1 Tax=Arachis ipaensis TaxID=130454 RepID=UPI000A2B3372|nr:pentatricopeptide repeat-containing protein At5g24830 isoform X7 [Arachis ipaensis]